MYILKLNTMMLAYRLLNLRLQELNGKFIFIYRKRF